MDWCRCGGILQEGKRRCSRCQWHYDRLFKDNDFESKWDEVKEAIRRKKFWNEVKKNTLNKRSI